MALELARRYGSPALLAELDAERGERCPFCSATLAQGDCPNCRVRWAGGDRAPERCQVCWTEYSEEERLGRKLHYESDFIGPRPPPSDEIEWLLLPCGHRYCAPCFVRAVEMFSRGEGVKRTFSRTYTSTLRCAQCRHEIEEEIVKANVPPVVFEAWLRASLRSALASFGSSVRHCPQPGCEFAVVIEEALDEAYDPLFPTGVICARPVECKNASCVGGTFCASCGEAWSAHESKTCQEIEAEKLTPEERSSRRWKREHARPCPRCGAATEKNGGCSHVTCSRCGGEWCWVCQEAYKGGSHRCAAVRTGEALRDLAERAHRERERDADRDRPRDRDRDPERDAERAERRRRLREMALQTTSTRLALPEPQLSEGDLEQLRAMLGNSHS